MPARSTPRPRRVAAVALAASLAAVLALGACATEAPPAADPQPAPSAADSSTSTVSPPVDPDLGSEDLDPVDEVDPDEPTGWGPTVGELAEARAEVAGWGPARLAGQVIVARYRGTDPAGAAALVREHHLAGMSVTGDNVVDETQVRALTSAVDAAARADGRDFPGVVGVDQEGGTVEQLRGIATEFPSFAYAGSAVGEDARAGSRIVRRAAGAAGLELRDLGFTWVFAPVADVTIGAADPTIGSRSASTDPALAARAVRAALTGYEGAGIVTTTKHFPGHGAVTADSHLTLPELDVPLPQLRARDLVPFVTAVDRGAPAVMMSHIAVDALAPGDPASLAPEVYDFLRDDLGFEGVAITDSLGMGAVVARPTPAVQALRAGADLLLMPADTERTARTVSAAIASGLVERSRAEEAAARVVALQRWQQRVAQGAPVPPDVTTRAAQAAADLTVGPTG